MAIINQLPHPTSGGGGGGGGETETVIWTNPSPSSSKAGADYTLTQGLSNFDKIRIEYAYANSHNSPEYSVTYPVYDANGNYMFPSGDNNAKMAVLLQNASGYIMARAGYVKSDTVLHFNTATRVGGSSTSNTALIIWNIYGIKSS